MNPFTDGLSAGLETSRSYTSEDFPSGSQRSVDRWLTTLVGRDDVIRVWLKPIGSKATVWEHTGPLATAPDLDELFHGEDAGRERAAA
jgi:hypothetical protein